MLVTPWRRLGVSLLTLCLAIGALPLSANSALALSPNVVISQVYAGGGNSGAQEFSGTHRRQRDRGGDERRGGEEQHRAARGDS